MVSLQHEYGIWGPDDGAGVLDFLAALAVPAVATLHTVLPHPTLAQRRIMSGILDSTAAVVVMSRSAATILADRYAADLTRVEVIPHGVPELPFVDPDSVKPAVGLQGRRILLSFGLVGASKGYESVIEAMPAVVRAVPDASYVILGATHPELLRSEGERYRTRLETLVADLGMTEHVIFVDRFVGAGELGQWLEAADVFVTPYPNLDQIVSGTLSYAMAAGKASVSTPYLYAAELLSEGRGRLVPSQAPAAMTDALVELLLDHDLRSAMAEKAYAHGRGMIWPRVAANYERLFERLRVRPHDLATLEIASLAVPSA
jgi:glycosyltransferase involved in cell wall biosynthesis